MKFPITLTSVQQKYFEVENFEDTTRLTDKRFTKPIDTAFQLYEGGGIFMLNLEHDYFSIGRGTPETAVNDYILAYYNIHVHSLFTSLYEEIKEELGTTHPKSDRFLEIAKPFLDFIYSSIELVRGSNEDLFDDQLHMQTAVINFHKDFKVEYGGDAFVAFTGSESQSVIIRTLALTLRDLTMTNKEEPNKWHDTDVTLLRMCLSLWHDLLFGDNPFLESLTETLSALLASAQDNKLKLRELTDNLEKLNKQTS